MNYNQCTKHDLYEHIDEYDRTRTMPINYLHTVHQLEPVPADSFAVHHP